MYVRVCNSHMILQSPPKIDLNVPYKQLQLRSMYYEYFTHTHTYTQTYFLTSSRKYLYIIVRSQVSTSFLSTFSANFMFKLTLNVEMNVLINRRKKNGEKPKRNKQKNILQNNSNISGLRGVTLCFIFDRFNKGCVIIAWTFG